MASPIARAYVKMIEVGKRVIDDVRPDKLKLEVQELLIEQGLYELAGVDEPKVEEDVIEDVPAETSPVEEIEEPIEESEDEVIEPAPVDEVKEDESPVDDEPTEEGDK